MLRPCKHWNREIWNSGPIGALIVRVHHWDEIIYRSRTEPAHRTISLEYLRGDDDYDSPNGVTMPVYRIARILAALEEAKPYAVIPSDYAPMCEGCCRDDMEVTVA